MSAPTANPNRQLEQVNRAPLNQEAKRWLRVAKAEFDPSSPYLVQLLLWGLGQKRVPVWPERRSSLQLAADDLLAFPPEKAMRFLLQSQDSEDQESNLSVDHLQSQRTPEDAAWEAIQALDRALLETVSQYPPQKR